MFSSFTYKTVPVLLNHDICIRQVHNFNTFEIKQRKFAFCFISLCFICYLKQYKFLSVSKIHNLLKIHYILIINFIYNFYLNISLFIFQINNLVKMDSQFLKQASSSLLKRKWCYKRGSKTL